MMQDIKNSRFLFLTSVTTFFAPRKFSDTNRKKSSESLAPLNISTTSCLMRKIVLYIMGQRISANLTSEPVGSAAQRERFTGSELNVKHPAHFISYNILNNKRLQELIQEHPDSNQWSIQRLDDF